MLLAYFGPETMLPLTSILAAVGGFMLMFGRKTLKFGSLLIRTIGVLVGRKSTPTPTMIKRPHVMSREKYASENAARTETEEAGS